MVENADCIAIVYSSLLFFFKIFFPSRNVSTMHRWQCKLKFDCFMKTTVPADVFKRKKRNRFGIFLTVNGGCSSRFIKKDRVKITA
jgi:hypothetical protein